ncbi:MAG TPA: acetate--CoA ligase family protein, partial [Xanthobacteraceae bacterium]
DAGVPVVAHRLCQSAAECVAAWKAIDGPVAIKGCSRDMPHKSEFGLVRLGVNDEAAAADAFEAMHKIMRDHGARFEGVLVAAMLKGRRELVIGAHRDPTFGPVVLVGDGGKYVEALGDVRVLLPPFTAAEVERKLRTLRIAPLLDGVRGEPPLDLAAFCEAAVKIGALMLAPESRIASLDLNPVMVGAAGEACAVADALVVQQT